MSNSPAKKLNFDIANKENMNHDTPSATDLDLKTPHVDVVKSDEKPAVAPGIKPEEAHEPLLQDNPQRFVLFPIKYHEVRLLLARREYSDL